MLIKTYFDVVSPMVVTAFSEQPVGNNAVYVQLVQHGISVLLKLDMSMSRRKIDITGRKTDLAETRCENDDLVYLAHLLQEVVNTGTFNHIDIVPVVLDLDGHDIICLLY